jgi:thiamine kinase-like enzyme
MKPPKYGNILISNIQEKIEKKLKELGLKPEISPSEFLKKHKNRKHRYFSACQEKNGKKVGFYSRLHFNLDAKNKFNQEIEFLLKLKENDFEIKKNVPQIINFGKEKDFEWFEREFTEGKPLGFSRNLTQKINLRLVPKIVKIIFNIQKIPSNFLSKIKSFNIKNYLAKEIYEKLAKEKVLEKKLVFDIQNFIKKNWKLLQKENKYFCHGDLNLGNVISDKKNIWIIDWELVHLNNFAYDLGYLWSHFWQAKKDFRKSLILKFLKKLPKEKIEKFKIVFPIVVAYLALGGINFKERKKINAIKRKNFYSQVLKNFFNFEKLIKL